MTNPAPAPVAPLDPFHTTGDSPPVPHLTVGTVTHSGFRISFETIGRPDGPVVVVLGGISAGPHLCPTTADASPGWWPAQVGAGRAIDTDRFRVVGMEFLGAPGTALAEASSQAVPTTLDQADAVAAVLAAEGIDRASFIGASYGGMVGFAMAARHPLRVTTLITFGAAHRTHPYATAVRSIQRRVVRELALRGRQDTGLVLARALAMTTYRSSREFERRFSVLPLGETGEVTFEVERYLVARGADFSQRFDAEAFSRLSQSLDLHRIEPEDVDVSATVVSFRDDTLVPPWLVRELATRLPRLTREVEIDTIFGHDAFLKEVDAVSGVIRGALDGPRRDSRWSPQTKGVRAAVATARPHGDVMPPLHLSATFQFDDFDRPGRYDYTRSGNPTRDALAEAVADLEGAAGAVICGSGLGAATTVLNTLPTGGRVLAPHDCYGGTRRLLDALANRGSIRVEYFDLTAPDRLPAALSAGIDLVWVETPSNPLLRITDIEAVARVAHRHAATVVVDNTFLSPAGQRPLELGADLVVHSTTKLLNGHSDVVGGAIAAADPHRLADLRWWTNCLGVTGAPFDAYLTLRGLRTLHARWAQHAANAERLAQTLRVHPAVRKTHYPGLDDHPGHYLAARQQRGFGSIVSFELRGGAHAARTLVRQLRLFTLAESLGGVESLVAHPATMTHASMDRAAQHTAGITGGLLRLSVGIEDGRDLEADLVRGLDRLENTV